MSDRSLAGQVPFSMYQRFNGGVDRGFVMGADLCLGGVAGDRHAGHDDRRDDPQDRHDGQQFHQRETVSLTRTRSAADYERPPQIGQILQRTSPGH